MTAKSETPVAVEAVETFVADERPENEDRVVAIDRISRTVKGGRRIRFRAVVVIGDRNGHIGLGVAKANDVQTAIAKAKNQANKIRLTVPIVNDTIAYEVNQNFGKTKVMLKPAPKGHSIIAGGSVRAVVELAGIKNIVSKSIGSSNTLNNAMATYLALKQLTDKPITRRGRGK